MRFLLSLSVMLGLASFAASAVAGDNDDRVVTYLKSADELIADSKHIVAGLAGEETAWTNSVLPNLEIWLFGVNAKKPVGLDVLFDADKGRVIEFHVPIANRRQFLTSNLGDVGVTVKQDKSNKNLYQLEDVIEGWLLFTNNQKGDNEYGSIVTNKANLPTKSPTEKFDVFEKAGYEAGIRWVATEATKAQRDKGFDKMRTELLSAIKKRPDESAAQFELRRLAVEQNATRLTRMLSNTAELMAGWNTDVEKHKYYGSSTMTGLPGSNVEKNIMLIGTEPSAFAKVATPETAAMSARVMLPLAEIYQTEQAKMYAVSLTALKERIEKKEELSAGEKTARQSIAEKFVQIATDSLSLGWLDVYAELAPSQEKLYTGILGLRVKDSAVARSIVEQLPAAQKGWNTKLDVAEESGVKIHLIDMKGKLPATLKDHFGGSGEAYVATGDKTIWLAAGPDGLSRLKSAIQAANGSGGVAVNTPLKLMMHVHPALEIGKSLVEDKDIEVFRTLREGTLLKGKGEEGEPKKDEDRRVNRNALKNFKWQDTALKALEGGQDVVTLEIMKDGSALKSQLNVEEGVMKAIGKVVAKFAVEMLQ